ncbi:MAG: hypothetical protein IJP22_02840 [Clostridia bacterium]|nr:hypothetical protein [Clostridia bacterium]
MSEFEELKQKYNNEMQKYVDAAAQNTENEELQASPTPSPPIANEGAIQKGYIQVRVSALQESVPIVGAKISITRPIGSEAAVLWSDITDESGKSGIVELPAPDKALSESPNQSATPYAVYNVKVEAQGFYTVYNINVQVFSGELSIVAVDMVPKKETELFYENDITYTNPPSNLLDT